MTWTWLWKKRCLGTCGLPAGEDPLGEVLSGYCSLQVGRRNKEDLGTTRGVSSRQGLRPATTQYESARRGQNLAPPKENQERHPPYGIAAGPFDRLLSNVQSSKFDV